MPKIDLSKYKIKESDGVFTFKNDNTTLGFVRFNSIGEVEYIFVNTLFIKQGLETKLLKLNDKIILNNIVKIFFWEIKSIKFKLFIIILLFKKKMTNNKILKWKSKKN